MIELFDQKKNCCSCAACMNICPKQAIRIKSDADGFNYPEIDRTVCIECGLCKKVCAFQNVSVNKNDPIATYVAISKDKDVLSLSSSGGAFVALASLVIKKKGVVFGCAYNDSMEPEHICVDNLLDIKKIQGSKYVQSNINNTYTQAKKYLKEGRQVLFTGTPCQIAGFKSYIGKEYSNLITVDLICHGVPSIDFFKGYIKYIEKNVRGTVIDFKFRDKSKGWGHVEKVVYRQNGVIKEKLIQPFESYYHSYFLSGDILRENCYECKYACKDRQGDFTIGDYWGIEKVHPKVDTKNGVSILLVNTPKAFNLMDEIAKYLDLTDSVFEQAIEQNEQLKKPTCKSDRRAKIFKAWNEGGYNSVAHEYYKLHKKDIILSKIKLLVPHSIKRFLKRIITRN